MKKNFGLLTFFIGLSVLITAWGANAQNLIEGNRGSSFPDEAFNNYSLLDQTVQQAAFEENKGQITGTDADKVDYFYRSGNLSVFLLKTGIAYQFNRVIYPKGYRFPNKFEDFASRKIRAELEQRIQTESYRMDITLVGANPNPVMIKEGRSSDYVNYYNYSALDVHSFCRITYKNVYPNIDWVIYKSGDHIKYDFIVRPGGNLGDIVINVSDAETISLSDAGILNISNRLGYISEEKPVSYQDGKAIASSFLVKDNEIRFDVKKYNASKTLTIDPTISWATYYGGGMDDFGQACGTDISGNVYLGGISKSANNIASGGFKNTYGGGNYDAFLVKFSDQGQRLWATYYGGGGNDYGYGCAIDKNGNVYLSGTTSSLNSIGSGGFQNTPGGGDSYDGFLIKFNSSGQRLWGTYYGQEYDDIGNTCAVDASGNVYLTGSTVSPTNMASGGFQNGPGGDVDVFLAKFKSNGERLWATYYGGSSYDEGLGCSTDASNNVYVVGKTGSINGIASNGCFQEALGGGTTMDAFLVKFNSAGERLWATYYGGIYFEQGQSCAIDGNNDIYMVGYTISPDDIASGGFQNISGGGYDAFLVKFDSVGQRLWASYYGGSFDDYGSSCVVCDDNVYLVGYTSSLDNIASGGFQDTLNGYNYDAFLVRFNRAGQRKYASYYGGNNGDYALACALDANGKLFLAGYTTSSNNIALSGFQDTLGGAIDAFVAKIDINCSLETSISKIQDEIVWSIFPNPVVDLLHICYNKSMSFSNFSITDITGKTLSQGKISKPNANNIDIDIQFLKSGIYFIKLMSKSGVQYSAKFVKNR